MRCERCKQYMPEGLGIKNCPACGFEIVENETNMIPMEENLTNPENIEPNASLKKPRITYTKTKLSNEQMSKINSRLDKELFTIGGVALIIFIFIICSFIPIGFLPLRRRYRYRDMDQNSSLIQSMGIIPVIILWIIIGSFLYLIVLRKTIFFKLKKDVVDSNVYTLETKVTSIKELKGDTEKEYFVFIENNSAGIQKLHYLQSEFPDIAKEDKIRVTLTQHARFVIHTEKIVVKKIRDYNTNK